MRGIYEQTFSNLWNKLCNSQLMAKEVPKCTCWDNGIYFTAVIKQRFKVLRWWPSKLTYQKKNAWTRFIIEKVSHDSKTIVILWIIWITLSGILVKVFMCCHVTWIIWSRGGSHRSAYNKPSFKDRFFQLYLQIDWFSKGVWLVFVMSSFS